MQNLLAFRFSNGIFEPLWNKNHVDHIQFTVAETVGVEGRGKYYDQTGVLRDMIQNHMFQMLAYLCMEPPASFKPDAVRNEKSKLLEAVRVMTPKEVALHAVRGQYGPGKKADGTAAVGYRQEPDVNPQSCDGDVRGPQAAHRQLALGGRAGLPAVGQGPVEARHGDRRPVQEGAGGDVPRTRRRQTCWRPTG